MPAIRTTRLRDLLTPETVQIGLERRDKEGVLDELVDLLDGHPAVDDLEQVREAVRKREEVMSTGVGEELALPHAKTGAVRETIAAFAVAQDPVDFDSIDGEPVRLLFLLVGTEKARSQHIKILSRASRLLNREDFREWLLQARAADEVLRIFADGDKHVSDPA
jgi:fructose-specific phosphotransferase system IIA component